MTCLTDFLTDIATDATARDLYLANPEAAMAAAGLGACDRSALLRGKSGIRGHAAGTAEPKGFIWSNSLESDMKGFIWGAELEAIPQNAGSVFGTCTNEGGLGSRH